MAVQDYVAPFKNMPDHSDEIQAVGKAIAETGIASERRTRLRQLLGLECVDVSSELVDALTDIVIEGIANS